ncbi:hypothetical protein N7535_009134 [Penicillium sp. DV-2018c]|nr:hypothetical protein N7535_009134 [Penicillium sp. DV-2018c]
MDDRLNKPLPFSPTSPTTPRGPHNTHTGHTSSPPAFSGPGSQQDGSIRVALPPPYSRDPPTSRPTAIHSADLLSKIQDLQEALEANSENVTSLIAGFKGLEESVELLENRAEFIERDLIGGLDIGDKNSADVAQHDSRLGNVEESLDNLEYDLRNINMKIDILNREIERIDKNVQVDDHGTSLVNNEAQAIITKVDDIQLQDKLRDIADRLDEVVKNAEAKIAGINAWRDKLAQKIADVDKNVGNEMETFRREHKESLEEHLRAVDRLERRLDDVALWKEEELTEYAKWWQQRFDGLCNYVAEMSAVRDRGMDRLRDEARLSRRIDASRQDVPAASTDLHHLETKISLLKGENQRLARMMARVNAVLDLHEEVVAGEIAVSSHTPPATGGASSGAAPGASGPGV